jgi:hypothetical protein
VGCQQSFDCGSVSCSAGVIESVLSARRAD